MFKNATIYTFGKESKLSSIDWKQIAEENPQREPGPLDYQSIGFTELQGGELVNVVGETAFMAVHVERRVLPAASIEREVKRRVKVLEEQTGEKVGRKARAKVKDDAVMELLPKALIKPQRIELFIDAYEQLVVVDATRGQADEVIAFLRHCIGSMPVLPATTSVALATVARHWLVSGTPEGITLGERAKFRSDLDRSSASFAGRLPSSEEIVALSDHSQHPVSIELHTEKLSFVLDEHFSMKAVKPTDFLMQEIDDASEGAESIEEVQAGSRLLMRAAIVDAITLLASPLQLNR